MTPEKAQDHLIAGSIAACLQAAIEREPNDATREGLIDAAYRLAHDLCERLSERGETT
jgi:hypothetical protein